YGQHQLDEKGDELIGGEKEQARQSHHDQHHDRRNQRLLAGRPGHLAGFLAHFLQELDRVGASHRSLSSLAMPAHNQAPPESPRRLWIGYLVTWHADCNTYLADDGRPLPGHRPGTPPAGPPESRIWPPLP